jgi:hypothetical protein
MKDKIGVTIKPKSLIVTHGKSGLIVIARVTKRLKDGSLYAFPVDGTYKQDSLHRISKNCIVLDESYERKLTFYKLGKI